LENTIKTKLSVFYFRLQLTTFVERFSTLRYDSPLSVLSKDYSFSKFDVILIAPRELVDDSRMGTASVKGADKRAKCSISYFLRAVISCVETAHPSSLHVSITWFYCELGPQIWGIGACTLRAQWTSTSAVRRLR
jgi:hypothetical protein